MVNIIYNSILFICNLIYMYIWVYVYVCEYMLIYDSV